MTKKEFWEKAYLAALASPGLSALTISSTYSRLAENMSAVAKSVASEAVMDLERNWGDQDGNIAENEAGPYR